MDFAIPLWLLILIGIGLAAAFSAGRWQSRRPGPAVHSLRDPARNVPAPALAQELERLHAASEWDAILRLLDRRLPEWTVSSSLIEVARSLGSLEREIAAVPASPVSNVVTTRLSQQASAVSSDLWRLAARIDAVARQGYSRSRREFNREDEALVRLLAAIQEARGEVTELVLGPPRRDALDRAEGRFRSLAATARDLQELEGDSSLR